MALRRTPLASLVVLVTTAVTAVAQNRAALAPADAPNDGVRRYPHDPQKIS